MTPDIREKFIDYLTEQGNLKNISADGYLSELARCELEYGGELHTIPDYAAASDLIIQIKKKYPGKNGLPPLSANTGYKIASMLKVFFDFCVMRRLMPYPHPFYPKHGFQKDEQPEPEFFDSEDPQDQSIVDKVLWYPNLTQIWKAIVWTFYAAGLRRKELCGLNFPNDIDRAERFFHVRKEVAKKERWRYVPYDVQTALFIEEHCRALEIRWADRIKQEGFIPLFPTRDGRRMNPGSVWKFLKRLQIKLGLSVKINPHKWRHSVPARLLDNGMELTSVSDLMGHADPKTTKRYTHRRNKTLRNAYDRAVDRSLRPHAIPA